MIIITQPQPSRSNRINGSWKVIAVVAMLFLVLCQHLCYCGQLEVSRIRATAETDKAFFEIYLSQPSGLHVVLTCHSDEISVVSQRPQVTDHHAFTVSHLSPDRVYTYAIMNKENSKRFSVLFKGTIVTNDQAHQGRHNEQVHDMNTQQHYQHHYVNTQQQGHHNNNDHHQELQQNYAQYQTNYAQQQHHQEEQQQHHFENNEQYQHHKVQYDTQHREHHYGDQAYQHNYVQ